MSNLSASKHRKPRQNDIQKLLTYRAWMSLVCLLLEVCNALSDVNNKSFCLVREAKWSGVKISKAWVELFHRGRRVSSPLGVSKKKKRLADVSLPFRGLLLRAPRRHLVSCEAMLNQQFSWQKSLRHEVPRALSRHPSPWEESTHQ